ncbi:MAG: hypothetical protein R2880_19185 [Deinococcales bacterium]
MTIIAQFHQGFCQSLNVMSEAEKLSAKLGYPELLLNFSLGLSKLANKVYAQEQFEAALRLYGHSHGLSLKGDLLAQVKQGLGVQDADLIGQINACLNALGDDRRIELSEIAYLQGMRYMQQGDYRGAMELLSQVCDKNLVKLRWFTKGEKPTSSSMSIKRQWQILMRL